jgi:hypothetical protein
VPGCGQIRPESRLLAPQWSAWGAAAETETAMTNNSIFRRILDKQEAKKREAEAQAILDQVELSVRPPKEIRVPFRDYRRTQVDYRSETWACDKGERSRPTLRRTLLDITNRVTRRRKV